MNKSQLVEAVALECNLSKVEARKAVDATIQLIHQALQEGDRVTISGLGSFCVQQHAERMGRNPRTGTPVPIPAHKSIKFRPLIEIE
ncbi:MAG: HU family DNA-binding protein [Rikenellaceae bacterium]|nr:HU family DNA-binding protein [Rikenellaceae bacterium]